MKKAPISGIIESLNTKNNRKRCHNPMIYQNDPFENTESLFADIAKGPQISKLITRMYDQCPD